MTDLTSYHILFYDGTCRFCERSVQFGLQCDGSRQWRYSPLQSEFAARQLARYDIDATLLDRVHAMLDFETPTERVVSGADAALALIRTSSPKGYYVALRLRCMGWRLMGGIGAALPRRLRDWLYMFVARNRYRIFGRYDTCKVPSPEQAALFIE